MSCDGRAGDSGGAGGAAALMTARLCLEPLRVAHARELAEVLGDRRLHQFIGGQPLSCEQLRARHERQVLGQSEDGRERWLNWVVRERASGRAGGQMQATVTPGPPVQAQLAWTIAIASQGRGYAREAARAVAEFLRGQGVDELVAHIHPDHVASRRVAESLA